MCFCRRWWRSQAATESVGGLPGREEPLAVDFSDRVGDRLDDDWLVLRDAEFEKLDDVRDEFDIVEV